MDEEIHLLLHIVDRVLKIQDSVLNRRSPHLHLALFFGKKLDGGLHILDLAVRIVGLRNRLIRLLAQHRRQIGWRSHGADPHLKASKIRVRGIQSKIEYGTT